MCSVNLAGITVEEFEKIMLTTQLLLSEAHT
jgi:PHD/YefM family antitoxin component YafN of YafNO toxin-antitoxin module